MPMCFICITRGILEMKLQSIMCERKHLYDCQCVQSREKNRYGVTVGQTEVNTQCQAGQKKLLRFGAVNP